MESHEIIVMDTHTLVWLTENNKQLGKQAQNLIHQASTKTLCECDFLLGSRPFMSKATN